MSAAKKKSDAEAATAAIVQQCVMMARGCQKDVLMLRGRRRLVELSPDEFAVYRQVRARRHSYLTSARIAKSQAKLVLEWRARDRAEARHRRWAKQFDTRRAA